MTHSFAQQVEAGTSGQAHLAVRPDDIASYGLFPPPLKQRQAIAVVFDSVDEAIERAEEIIAVTERRRDALLHDLLTQGVPLRRTEWKEIRALGTIPAAWDVVHLGDVGEPSRYGAVSATRPYDSERPRHVRITDLPGDGRLTDSEPRSAYPVAVQKHELLRVDSLFARSAAMVGKTHMYRAQAGPCVCARYLIISRTRVTMLQPVLLEAWTHFQLDRRWVQSILRADAQPNINATEHASLRSPLPSLGGEKKVRRSITALAGCIADSQHTIHMSQSNKATASNQFPEGDLQVSSQSDSRQGFAG